MCERLQPCSSGTVAPPSRCRHCVYFESECIQVGNLSFSAAGVSAMAKAGLGGALWKCLKSICNGRIALHAYTAPRCVSQSCMSSTVEEEASGQIGNTPCTRGSFGTQDGRRQELKVQLLLALYVRGSGASRTSFITPVLLQAANYGANSPP